MLISPISAILIVLSIIYCLYLILLFFGLFRLKKVKNDFQYTVSIIVPARNEEDNIANCLSALVSQEYPEDKYEIIVVDDRSEDGTPEVVSSFIAQHNNIRLIRVTDPPPEISPRKNALNLGVKNSSGEIVFSTDADCRPKPTWIPGMIRHFDQDVGLVAGFSPIERDQNESPLWEKLLSLDSLALASLSAGGIGLGIGLICPGRNLAYRREVYEQIGGFGKTGRVVSGDYTLLLQSVIKDTDWKVGYASSEETHVPTNLPSGIEDFINQRRRHASTGLHYPKWLTLPLISVYIYSLLLLVTVPVSLINLHEFSIPLFSLGVKALFEFLLILKGAYLLGKPDLLRYFPLGEILHIPYVVVFGAWGSFGKFWWKERRHRSLMNTSP